MGRYKFQSGFAKEMADYLGFKKACNFNPESFRHVLNVFDRFLVSKGISEPVLQREVVDEWIKRRDGEADMTWYTRVNSSKLFLMYLALRGYEVCIPRDVKYRPRSFVPYIYSREEATRYFKAVDQFASGYPKDALQYPVLFRILYCCGTRIGETLAIQKKDMDLEKGVIRLRHTKGNKERFLPVGEDLRRLLVTFSQKCFYELGEDDWVFTNSVGNQLEYNYLYENHRIFLREAGITFLGEHRGPRIHDWRHHFAIHAFKRMADSGLDMYVALPVLAAYLGHESVFSTEYYVRLAIEHFPDIDEKFKEKFKAVFGETEDETN